MTPDGERVATHTGDGPVDAVYKAIEEAIGLRPELELSRVEAITRSTEALGPPLRLPLVGKPLQEGLRHNAPVGGPPGVHLDPGHPRDVL
jgi:hypothetical protein